MKLTSMALLVASLGLAATATAGPARTAGGTWNGVSWQATSTIVGGTSTATAAGGGNPIYFAQMPKYSGVVALIMDYGSLGRFICTGTLLPDRQSILTAAHCVTNGPTLDKPLSTTAYFYGGSDPDTIVPTSAASTPVSVVKYVVNSAYSGNVIDDNDIAVLWLDKPAPSFAASYGLYLGGDLTGQDFNVAGYGRRSDTGGAVGANLGTGRLRQGDNRFDFRLGDPDFAGEWADIFGQPASELDYSFLSDFDNGKSVNDASCAVAAAFGLGGAKYCNLGRGATEVGVAGGDSGGPQFINGLIAAVTSYGLTFGSGFGDVDNSLNSSWGEFSGFVPVYIHSAFIRGAMIPEPATWSLILVGTIGFAVAARRRRSEPNA